jgi:hypothetical protein
MRLIVFSSVLFFLLLWLPTKVSSVEATLTFNPQSQNVILSESFSIRILLNTDGVAVNRVLAKVSYPANLITPQSINYNNSFVSLWYQNNIGQTPGQLILEGGVSGNGVTGNNLEMATVNFDTTSAGTAQISFSSDSAVYQESDGLNILSAFSSGTITIEEVTPSPSPTNAPTPTRTPIPMPSASPTDLTPTPSNLPISGNTSTTIIFVLFGIISTLSGLVLLRKV